MTKSVTTTPVIGNRQTFIRNILILASLLIGLYIVLPKVHEFRVSLHDVSQAETGYILLALLASGGTYLLATATYCLVALRPLRYPRTLLIELSNLLINRIVPAGLGGVGLNFAYLRSNRHTTSEAVTVVTVNNLLGLSGHLTLLLGLLIFDPAHVNLAIHLPRAQTLCEIGIIAAVLIMTIAFYFRHTLRRLLAGWKKSVKLYKQRPQKLIFGLITSMALTLLNAISFWFCCHAVHIDASFFVIFIVFSLSVIVGTATPTPGGLGGVEASLVAGLVSLRFGASTSLAAVLSYRLVSYWFPLLIGAICFWVVQKKHYLTQR